MTDPQTKRPWEPQEDNKLKMFRRSGFTPIEVARSLNRPVPSIKRRAIALRVAWPVEPM